MVTKEASPVVGLSLVIKSDFSWAVTYCNQAVPVEHCTILQKVPVHIKSGKAITFSCNIT